MTYPKDRFTAVSLEPGSFWASWHDTARKATLPSLLDMLKSTGRWEMWDLKKRGGLYDAAGWGHLFWESDCAKWLEGACYFLRSHDDIELRRQVDELVDAIIAAQSADGYLNVHFTVFAPGQRWTNVRDWHEMYNAGHLFEAAVAFQDLTGDDRLTRAMLKFVSHIRQRFGPEQDRLHGYPGHPEIELALLKLHDKTGDASCLELASYFLSERGRGGGKFYREEQKRRGEDARIIPGSWPSQGSEWYQQAHALITDQQAVEGHAVRVAYLLTGLADLTVLGHATASQQDALWRLWRNMMSRKASVTGGVGAEGQWEGFARTDYSLPDGLDEQGGCYNETCAGLGILMLADRLQTIQLSGTSVTDLAERVLYNSSVTCGMSLDGTLFTYENRLASSQGDACRRFPYFDCSCCPPNVMRTLAIIGGYIWSPSQADSGGVTIHHFFSGTLRWQALMVRMQTEYPYDGRVTLHIEGKGCVRIRIPSWSTCRPAEYDPKTQYATLQPGRHCFDLAMKPRLIYSHPLTNRRAIAVAFGPLIYCLEDVDNAFEATSPKAGHFKDLTIDASILDDLRMVKARGPDGQAIVMLHAPKAGRRIKLPDEEPVRLPELDPAVSNGPQLDEELLDLIFVPYYFRANRTKVPQGSQMRVWIQDRGAFGRTSPSRESSRETLATDGKPSTKKEKAQNVETVQQEVPRTSSLCAVM